MANIKVKLKNNYEFTADSANENQDVLGKTRFLMINLPYNASTAAAIESNITAANMATVIVLKDGVQTAVFNGYIDAIFFNVNISGQGAVMTINAQKKT